MGNEAEKRARRVRLLTERDGPNCFYCDVELVSPLESGDTTKVFGNQQTFDHWIALRHGGQNLTKNLRLACYSCNAAKKDMDGEDFLKSKFLEDKRHRVLKETRKRHGIHPTGLGYYHPEMIRIKDVNPWISMCTLCGLTATSYKDALSRRPCIIFDGTISPLEGPWVPPTKREHP